MYRFAQMFYWQGEKRYMTNLTTNRLYQTGLKLKCLQKQSITRREITINLLKEVATKQMVSTSGKEGCGGALTTKQLPNGSTCAFKES